MLPTKNSPNSAKSNCMFPGKWREDVERKWALILTYLDSPMVKVFSSKLFLSFAFGQRRPQRIFSLEEEGEKEAKLHGIA